MRVELLYFDGCPGYQALLPRLQALVAQAGVSTDIELRRVETPEAAVAERFLGSPSVRVNGVDVEPGADGREDFGLKCRLFSTSAGLAGLPDEAWIRTALGAADGEQNAESRAGSELTDRTATGLERIGVGASRASRNRTVGVAAAHARLYRRVLEAFAASAPCSQGDVQAWAADLDVDSAAALEELEAADLIRRDDDGRIVTAYPFSARPTAHRVRIDDGAEVWAMCAIDALGIPFMVGRSATVQAAEPETGAPVEITIDPQAGVAHARPSGTVVVAATAGTGPSSDCLCPYVNTFTSPAAAQHYLAEHTELVGEILPLDQALQAGRMLFGDLLTTDAEPPPRGTDCC